MSPYRWLKNLGHKPLILRMAFWCFVSVALVVLLEAQWIQGFGNSLELVRKIGTKRDIYRITQALRTSYSRTGIYPEAEHIETWLSQRFPANSPLQIPIDRWGNALRYRTMPDRKGFSLFSMGLDGKFDTPDDFGIRIAFREKMGPPGADS